MNICIIDNAGKIPALKYGGTERVVWSLGKKLTEKGHKVTFLVPPGSYCDFATVVELNPKLGLDLQIPEDIDLVHLHFVPLVPVSKPYVITMHGNPVQNELIDENTIFISRNQAERYNSEVVVYNGLDWGDYPKPNLNNNRRYVHFLGKAAWKIKNVFGAIEIAKKADLPIKIIGSKKWTSRNLKRGFRYLLDTNIEFEGMLSDQEKFNVLSGSKALIFPVLWHEPFGLAVIESMYAGCAVFGTQNGSLPELITPETGYCGNSKNEIALALKEFNFKPEICHQYAKEKFNADGMVNNYLKYYEIVLNGKKLHDIPPTFNIPKNMVQPLG